MKLQISREDETIMVLKDFSDVTHKGELAQVMVELEIAKQELLVLWMKKANEE